MAWVVFIVLIICTDGVWCSSKVCSYQDILDFLNLTADNSAFQLTRPVLDHTHPTFVELDILLYAILSVVEKTQTFIPFIWAVVKWNNERISWDPDDFCGISELTVPTSLLWKPDLFFFEMIEKDGSADNPYMLVSSDGTIMVEQDIRLVSTCKMDVHKFPFDTQSCNITVSSSLHCVKEFRLTPVSNLTRATQFSREVMQSQGEWEFLHLSITSVNFTLGKKMWDQIVYTFTMKRRPLLHVINFLLPILFFLCLDLASFFIPDHRGEKLGFKVTVLLAISVLLLILNDILPSMSNKTPLIATYCIVIFALMLLSLLETILVTYLMENHSASQQKLQLGLDQETDHQEKEKVDNLDEKMRTSCSCIYKLGESEKQHELVAAVEEVIHGAQSGDSHTLLLILKELKTLQKTLNGHLISKEAGGGSAHWPLKINRVFFIFYISTVSLFLLLIYREWMT